MPGSPRQTSLVVVKRLSSDDATFLFVETREFPQHICGLTICNPTEAPNFGVDAVTDLLAARIPELPVMRWRVTSVPLGIDRPWAVEDTEVDLDYHVRQVAVPAPGGRKELERLIGRLIAYPLDRARPLWELWFIEGVEGGRVALLAKMHHALIDGVSGAGLTELLLDTSRQPRPPAVVVGDPLGDDGVPGWERRTAEGIFNLAVMPYRVARFARQTVAQQWAVRGLSNKPPRMFEAPHTRFNAEISAQRRVSTVRLPLERLKVVKRAFDVKLNDVVLAIVSGALRGYLHEREELPDRPLISLVPISTRADRKGDGGQFGNQISTMTVSLATDVTDPADRMKAIYRSSQGAKEMNKALRAREIIALSETMTPGMAGLAMRAYTASQLGSGRRAPINVVISNIPGPDHPYYVAGALVERMLPIGPLVADFGLNITCFSYNGSIDFGINTTPQVARDVDELADGFEPALRELEQAAGIVSS
jgi:diacylglycerol O-acyltransferase / wax synthase